MLAAQSVLKLFNIAHFNAKAVSYQRSSLIPQFRRHHWLLFPVRAHVDLVAPAAALAAFHAALE
jgi:hypothetical protein